MATPKVRIARPKNRPYEVRITDPDTKKEVRISVRSRDEHEARAKKKEVEAKLLLGIDAKPHKKKVRGPEMGWQDFREEYTDRHLRSQSCNSSEIRLDIAERILMPKTLSDVADLDALESLQSRLLAGEQSRYSRPRSPHTVRSYMAVVLAALNWAGYMEWIPRVPKLRKVKVSRLKHMKGRPISQEEFDCMLEATLEVVGDYAADSWRYVLRGLWESGLRLDELMHVSWDDANEIQPVWHDNRLPVLSIPHDKQKNATEESIPLLAGFEAVLLETPPHEQYSWIFNPASLWAKYGRKPIQRRPNAEWVSKIITRIGTAAGVIVSPAKGEKKAKFASAHDLRRSLAERLCDAGVPEREVAQVMRHASTETTRRHYAPGNVQKTAASIRDRLPA